MRLTELMDGIVFTAIGSYDERDIEDIVYDSRRAAAGTIFIALKGEDLDGHLYVKDAYMRGCRSFVIKKGSDRTASVTDLLGEDVLFLTVEDTRLALALMSGNFFSHPSKELKVIGITGTKGKTSITYILKTLLEDRGVKTGIIGTTGAAYGKKTISTHNTTPESYELEKILRQMADEGVEVVAMEVSSVGLKQRRVAGITFYSGIFTNISPDHIGSKEHKTFDEYYRCKKSLFRLCPRAVACADDPASRDMLAEVRGEKIFYGASLEADLVYRNAVPEKRGAFLGMRFELLEKGRLLGTYEISQPGEFSACNALAALACASQLGIAPEVLKEPLRHIRVPGRTQIVYMTDDIGILIDYAHNALSFEKIIETMRAYRPKRIILLFGAVGEHSQIRRREIGRIAARKADFSIITEKDPGKEDPQAICQEIAEGMDEAGGKGKYVILPRREAAVHYAIKEVLRPGDFMLFLGQGTEKHMRRKDGTAYYDEEATILQALRENGYTL